MKRSNDTAKPKTPSTKPLDGFVMLRRDAIPGILTELSDPARRVLIALCSFADGEGYCFPSREAIATRAGIHPAHKVSYATAELSKAGLLDIVQTGKRRCNTYTVKKVMYLQRVHHERGDVPPQGTGDVPSKGTSLFNDSHITRVVGDEERTSPSRKDSKRKTDPVVEDLLHHFEALHQQHTDSAYVPSHGEDRKALNSVLGTLAVEDIRNRMSIYFVRRDKWTEEKGFTVRNFCHMINGLRASGKRHKVSFFKQQEAERVAQG